MAEAATIRVIIKVVEIGGNFLAGIVRQISDFEDNIRWIERKMRSLHSYLKEADSKRFTNHEADNLIINIRDLAHDVEDILDTYFPDIVSNDSKGTLSLADKASFGKEIDKIKSRAEEIEKSRERCGVTADANARLVIDAKLQDKRRSMVRTSQELKIVGRESIMQKLEEEILSEESRLIIKSIVGLPGVGKTTVGKRVYERTKNGGFDVSAIVYVSQNPNLSELLLDIANQVGLSKGKVEENLESNLCLLLQEKKFLIFLDDIWDTETWVQLKIILPTHTENGSRIMVTSRHDDVGRYMGGERCLVRLNTLGKVKEKELFYLILLESDGRPLLPALREIGEKILKRCGGLPLAIVVMAGLLKAKGRSVPAWNTILERPNQGLGNDCSESIALSYHDLPTELKPLFLYFGMFPEDSEIFVNGLIHIWISEKLIIGDGSRKLWSIAEEKIDELVSRNLIQVCKRRSDGRVRSLRIHDVLHALCIKLAKDNNFFYILSELKEADKPITVRRVTSCTWKEQVGNREYSVPEKVRSCLCFGKGHRELLNFLRKHASNLRFLKTLIIEIGGGEENNVPDEIANLSGLSYLKLGGRFKSGIPSGLSNLKYLFTLMIISLSSPVHITGRIFTDETTEAFTSLERLFRHC